MDIAGQYFNCLCRTCMNELCEASSYDDQTKSQQQWQSIFDRINEESGAFQIAELLTNAVPQIEVQPSDELPKKICFKCLQQLLSVHRFQQMCLQSDKQLRQQVSKKQNDPSIPVTAMEGEIGTHDPDSCPLGSFQSSTTHQNIENSSVQEPLETAEQEVKPEVTEANDADIDQLLEDCRDSQGNLSEFIKNEPIEDNDQQLQKQNDEPDMEDRDDGDTIQSITSGKDAVMAIDTEAQQENGPNVKKHHSRHAEDDKPYKCPYCRRKFNTISNMYQHKARHEVACDICGKTIVKCHLKKHKLTHSNEKAHKCDFCGRRFNRITYLRNHIRTHTGEKPYKCKYCDRSFTQASNRTTHMRIHYRDNVHRCELCPLAFPTAKELRVHFATHKDEDLETRERNMKALKEAEVKLQLELSKKHIQKAAKCDLCGKCFARIGDLRRHMRIHHGDNIHRCKLCPLAFPLVKELRAHLTEHSNDDSGTRERNMKALKEAEAKLQLKLSETETQQPSKEPENVRTYGFMLGEDKPYRCPYCPRRFNHSGNMYRHKSIHKGVKREACDICGKRVLKRSLKTHKLIHSKGKAHKCDICEMGFAQMSNLRTHMRKHTGEKPYKCKYCERSFAQSSILVTHMRGHLGDNVHRCKLCPLAFPLAKELRAHLTEHNNDDAETRERNMKALKEAEAKLQLELSKNETQQPSKEQSQQQYEMPVQMEHSTHGEDKPYKCPYCTRKFNTISNMYQHKARHNLESHKLTHSNEKAHKCDFCGKCFARIGVLRQHMRIHTGEKPFKCKYCERSFVDPSHRRKHMRIHLGDNIYRCVLCPLAFPFAKELRAHLAEHSNDDSETRERNMKALKEAEAKLQLKLSKTETQQPSKE